MRLLDVEAPADLLEHEGGELTPLIRVYLLRNAPPTEHMLFEQSDGIFRSDLGHWDGLHPPGEAVLDGEQELVAVLGHAEGSHVVDGDLLHRVTLLHRNQGVSLVLSAARFLLAGQAASHEPLHGLVKPGEVEPVEETVLSGVYPHVSPNVLVAGAYGRHLQRGRQTHTVFLRELPFSRLALQHSVFVDF